MSHHPLRGAAVKSVYRRSDALNQGQCPSEAQERATARSVTQQRHRDRVRLPDCASVHGNGSTEQLTGAVKAADGSPFCMA